MHAAPTSPARSRAAKRAFAAVASAALASVTAWLIFRAALEPTRTTVHAKVNAVSVATLPRGTPSARTGLSYRPFTTDDVAALYPQMSALAEFDPDCGFRHRGGIDTFLAFEEHAARRIRVRTNRVGLRERDELRIDHPDLRILVTGDSHTDGVCEVDESFANQLEAITRERRPGWSVESLNAGCGAYSFYNYLGVLQRFAPLEPDVFIVCVYGGNDFTEVLSLRSVFEGLPPPPSHFVFGEELDEAIELTDGAALQGLAAARYFAEHPAQVAEGARAGVDVVGEIAAICAERGIELVVAYLPPQVSVQWRWTDERMSDAADALALEADDMAVFDALAERFIAGTTELGVAVVDLREELAKSDESAYWRTDAHLNVFGHRLVAEQLWERAIGRITEVSKHRGQRTADIAAGAPERTWRQLFTDLERAHRRDPRPCDELGARFDREESHARAAGELGPRSRFVITDEYAETRPAGARSLVAECAALDASTPVVHALGRGASVEHYARIVECDLVPAGADVVAVIDWGGDLLDVLPKRADRANAHAAWIEAALLFEKFPVRLREATRAMARATVALQAACVARDRRLTLIVVPPPCWSDFDEAELARESARGAGARDEEMDALARALDSYLLYCEELALDVIDGRRLAVEGRLHELDDARMSAVARRAIARCLVGDAAR